MNSIRNGKRKEKEQIINIADEDDTHTRMNVQRVKGDNMKMIKREKCAWTVRDILAHQYRPNTNAPDPIRTPQLSVFGRE